MPKYTLLHCYIAKLLNRKQYNNKTIQQFNNFKVGFSLIEITISMFLIAAFGVILTSASGSLLSRRRTDLTAIASKAATKEIEHLRNLSYSSINPDPTPHACSSEFIQAGTSSYLPSCMIGRSVYLNDPSSGLKRVVITLSWTSSGGNTRFVVMETVMTSGGL